MAESETAVQLSERELQVLEMVATGASNQQIARHLVISVNTVKVHLRNIFEKLDVQSRTEATLRAIQEGWVTLPEENSPPAEAPAVSPGYLLAGTRPAVLAPWQERYLILAGLLALALAFFPLIPRKIFYVPSITPYDDPAAAVPARPAEVDTTNRWSPQASLPLGRAGMGVGVVDGKVYAIGGQRGANRLVTGLVEVYDPISDTWSEGAAKPTAAADITAGVLGNKIYVPGGCTKDRHPLKVLDIYDPQADHWQQGPDLPSARCGYGLAVWHDKLYLLGGWNGETYEDTVFAFSAQENAWTVLKQKMPQAKGYFGAATFNDVIYVAGGYDGHEEFADTYAFMPATEQWVKKAPLNEKRGGLGLVAAPDLIYAVGGGWERPLASSEKYDPKTDSWTVFEAPFTSQWSNPGIAVVDTKIYAIGGWNGTEQTYRDEVVSYQFLFQLFFPVYK